MQYAVAHVRQITKSISLTLNYWWCAVTSRKDEGQEFLHSERKIRVSYI